MSSWLIVGHFRIFAIGRLRLIVGRLRSIVGRFRIFALDHLHTFARALAAFLFVIYVRSANGQRVISIIAYIITVQIRLKNIAPGLKYVQVG